MWKRALSRLPRPNLRERLSLLSLLGMTVFIAAFAVVGGRAVMESTNETLRERQSAAQGAAQYIDRLLDRGLDSLRHTADAPPPGALIAASAAAALRAMAQDSEGYVMLALVNGRGEPLGVWPPQPGLDGRSLFPAEVTVAAARGPGAVSRLSRLPGADRALIWLVVPAGDAAADTFLAAAVDLADPAALFYIGLSHPSGGGVVQLLDAGGVVINRTQGGPRFQPSENQAFYRDLFEAGQATVTSRELLKDGVPERRVVAFAPLTIAPWAITVEQDESETFAVSRRLSWQLGSLALAFGIIIVSMMWFTASRVLRPVSALTQAAGRIAGGDLQTPVPLYGGDELGLLSTAFDNMRRNLADSYSQIQTLYRQTRLRYTREQTMLLNFSQDMLEMVDTRWTLDRAAAVAATLCGGDGASLILADGPGRTTPIRVVHGGVNDRPLASVAEEESVRLTMQDRAPVLVTDFCADRRFSLLPVFAEPGARSGLAVPMLHRDRLVGVLYVHSHQPGAFDQQDVDVISLLANQTALAVDKAHFLQESTRRYREMSILYEFSQSISHALSVTDLCERLATALQTTLSYEHVDVLILDESRSELVSGVPARRPSSRDAGQGVSGRALAEGKPVRVDDVSDVSDRELLEPDTRAVLCVPIPTDVGMGGVIEVQSSRPAAFTADDERLLGTLAGPVGIVMERARLFQETQRQAQEFSSLYEVGAAVGSSLHLDQILHSVVSSAITLLEADTCSIMLLDEVRRELTMQACQGAMTARVGEVCQSLGDGIAGWVAESGEPLLVQGDQVPAHLRNITAREHVTSAISVPLKSSGRTLGVINVSSQGKRRFTDSDVLLLTRLAADAAMALDNAHLYDELRQSFMETVAALAQAVDAKDPYTRGHSERVTELALAIGAELKVTDDEMAVLRSAAVLHDIGKIGIAEQILRKPGPLDADEWATMRQHPDLGAGIVGPVSSLGPVVPILQHHHERWDGTGYPGRLSGEEIPLGSRILAVADAYEAMTSDRAYRNAMSVAEALSILKAGSGHQWDPRVVKAFLRAHRSLPQ
jgi:HD-GYP domain-containing protein (c-di-GMP phosphodiesterase class II)/HAMP domain-containing protein